MLLVSGEFEQRRVACAERMASASASSTTTPGLPSDVAGNVVYRLGWFAFMSALVVPIMHFTMAWFGPEYGRRMLHSQLGMGASAALFLISAGMCALAWSKKVAPGLMLDLALLYEVAGALCLSLMEHCLPWLPDHPPRGISWIALWISVFVLVVPSSPGKSTLAALTSALMAPLGLMIQMAVYDHPAPTNDLLPGLFMPIVISATMSVVLGRFVYRLGAQVSKARELGTYELLNLIGKGGMGEVWRARHRMLAREAAVKLIRPEMFGADMDRATTTLRRFQREAQATAQLRSPHTIELYDFGSTEEGSFYYAMELLDGLDLEKLVERFGPQPASRVVQILRQACDSLAEAHAVGMVHRDIKPRNLFLCRLGMNHDWVKVLDFGLVKREMTGESQSQLTLEGVTTGTPAYMAPELALGGDKVDGRADIYALGCVGYWLLTGKLVFERESAMATVLAHVQTAPEPPSARTELEIPTDLERVILQCLEKDPDKRPQSAFELARMLEGANVGQRWCFQQAERWWCTHLPASGDCAKVEAASAQAQAVC